MLPTKAKSNVSLFLLKRAPRSILSPRLALCDPLLNRRVHVTPCACSLQYGHSALSAAVRHGQLAATGKLIAASANFRAVQEVSTHACQCRAIHSRTEYTAQDDTPLLLCNDFFHGFVAVDTSAEAVRTIVTQAPEFANKLMLSKDEHGRTALTMMSKQVKEVSDGSKRMSASTASTIIRRAFDPSIRCGTMRCNSAVSSASSRSTRSTNHAHA